MNALPYLTRTLEKPLTEALEVFPVVVLTGARQVGKTTLVQHLPTAAERAFRTLDDLRVLDMAQSEPDLLVGESERMTLDEVQRVPDLLRAVKRAVDGSRTPGRFLLTGSANLLLMESVSETLAGRAVYLRLGPLTASERSGAGETSPWSTLLEASTPAEALEALEVPGTPSRSRFAWELAACQGGMPALLQVPQNQHPRWFEGYVTTYLERDLQQISSISALADFRRLLRIAALRLGGLVNRADLARDAGLSRPTAHRYLNLLQVSHQVRLLAPFASNRTKRLVKSPKLYFGDTGLAAYLAGVYSAADLRALPKPGAFLENLLLTTLDSWRETRVPAPEILFWRTAAGQEVDFVIEAAARLLPIEVKASSRIRPSDLTGLRRFLELHPSAPFGVVVHGGDETYIPAPGVVAVPAGRVL